MVPLNTRAFLVAAIALTAGAAWASAANAQDSYRYPNIAQHPPQSYESGLWREGSVWEQTPAPAPEFVAAPEYLAQPAVSQFQLFGGGDFLYVRPHFSEAIAFATGSQTPTSFETATVALDFAYDASFRAFIGGRWSNGGELRVSFWNIQGDVQVDGAATAPGQFIVDPFGGIVGSYVIIDPSDARGVGTLVTGGDRITATASVDMNVYDIELISASWLGASAWCIQGGVGARIADIEQTYESTITDLLGAPVSGGSFVADFVGAGPKASALIRRDFGACRQWSVNANFAGSLLLGSYHVGSTLNPAPGFNVRQDETMTKLIPVMEAEIGAAWKPCDHLNISMGWMFQGWLDMGASGGQFGGLFGGADDANIMSFDGAFGRVELTY